MTETYTVLYAFTLFLKQLILSAFSTGVFKNGLLLVVGVYIVGLIGRKYDLQSLIPKVRASTVSAGLYYLNLIAFGPVVFLLTERVQQLYDYLKLPKLNAEIWTDLPPLSLLVIALLAYDFVNYWVHRTLHKSWFWPVHAIHHSDSLMNGLTSYRVHFIETIMMSSCLIVLLTWLGLPDSTLSSSAICLTLFGVYIHMEMDWGHGRLRYLLASPRFHHWHHADTSKAYGKNLSAIFPFYDLLFGTYYVPGKCNVRLGAQGVPERNPFEMLLHPFKEWSGIAVRFTTKTLKRYRMFKDDI